MVVVLLTTGTSWTVPAGVTSIDVEVWGGGGGGGNRGSWPASGGGGGAYSKITGLSVTAGSSIAYSIGAGGAALSGAGDGNGGGDTWFSSTGTVLAKGGSGGLAAGNTAHAGGLGGAAASGVGSTKFSGGQGGSGTTTAASATGGGAAASPFGDGAAGVSASTLIASNGGASPSAGAAGTVSGTQGIRNGQSNTDGGGGGAGTISTGEDGGDGGFPGGGGGGITSNANLPSAGGGGQIRITYTAGSSITGTLSGSLGKPTMAGSGTIGQTGTLSGSLGKPTLAASGTASASGISGTLSGTLGKPTLSAAGTFTAPAISGTLSGTLGKPSLTAAGTVGGGAVSGVLAGTLGLPGLAASGITAIRGTVVASLGAPALTALGSNPWGEVTAPGPTWLGLVNNLLTASISTGSAAPLMGGSNVVGTDGVASSAWQTSAGTTTSWLQADTNNGSSVWRCVGLFRTNLTSAATIRVRLGNAAMTALAYDSGVLPGLIQPGYQQAVIMLPLDFVAASCRIDIVDSGNPDGFLNVPLIYGGALVNPGIGLTFAAASGRVSTEAVVQARSGLEWVTPGYSQRSFSMAYSGLKDSDVFAVLLPAIRQSRSNGNILFLPDTAASALSRQAIYGRLITSSDITYERQGDDRRAWQGVMRERC